MARLLPVLTCSRPFIKVPLKSGPKPRMLMSEVRPSERWAVTPGRRVSDSAMLGSGSLPMSSAEIASTMSPDSRFTSIADWILARMPVTVTSSSGSSAALSCTGSAATKQTLASSHAARPLPLGFNLDTRRLTSGRPLKWGRFDFFTDYLPNQRSLCTHCHATRAQYRILSRQSARQFFSRSVLQPLALPRRVHTYSLQASRSDCRESADFRRKRLMDGPVRIGPAIRILCVALPRKIVVRIGGYASG